MSAPPVLVSKAQAHLDKARHTYEIYQRLASEPDDFDWALTLLFYSAMHLVQAHAVQTHSKDPRRPLPRRHEQRDSYVACYLKPLFTPYTRLFSGSMQTRYDLHHPNAERLAKYHDEAFEPIRKFLAGEGIELLQSPKQPGKE